MPTTPESTAVFRNLCPDNERTLASEIGQRLRMRPASDHFSAFGFQSMTDWLIAEADNDPDALLIHPRTPYMAVLRGTAVHEPPPAGTGRMRFTREVFEAAAHERTDSRKRYFERATGRVIAADHAPGDGWVEIPYIDQRDELRRFLSDEEGAPVISDEAIAAHTWFVDVPRELDRVDPQLALKWRDARARFIEAEIKNWAATNNIPFNLIVAQRDAAPRAQQGRESSPRRFTVGDRRAIMLCALGSLGENELLNLSPLARAIFDAIENDRSAG